MHPTSNMDPRYLHRISSTVNNNNSIIASRDYQSDETDLHQNVQQDFHSQEEREQSVQDEEQAGTDPIQGLLLDGSDASVSDIAMVKSRLRHVRKAAMLKDNNALTPGEARTILTEATESMLDCEQILELREQQDQHREREYRRKEQVLHRREQECQRREEAAQRAISEAEVLQNTATSRLEEAKATASTMINDLQKVVDSMKIVAADEVSEMNRQRLNNSLARDTLKTLVEQEIGHPVRMGDDGFCDHAEVTFVFMKLKHQRDTAQKQLASQSHQTQTPTSAATLSFAGQSASSTNYSLQSSTVHRQPPPTMRTRQPPPIMGTSSHNSLSRRDDSSPGEHAPRRPTRPSLTRPSSSQRLSEPFTNMAGNNGFPRNTSRPVAQAKAGAMHMVIRDARQPAGPPGKPVSQSHSNDFDFGDDVFGTQGPDLSHLFSPVRHREKRQRSHSKLDQRAVSFGSPSRDIRQPSDAASRHVPDPGQVNNSSGPSSGASRTEHASAPGLPTQGPGLNVQTSFDTGTGTAKSSGKFAAGQKRTLPTYTLDDVTSAVDIWSGPQSAPKSFDELPSALQAAFKEQLSYYTETEDKYSALTRTIRKKGDAACCYMRSKKLSHGSDPLPPNTACDTCVDKKILCIRMSHGTQRPIIVPLPTSDVDEDDVGFWIKQ